MKTKVHKFEIMVIDHDDIGAEEAKDIFENTRYPNHCMAPIIMGVETKEVEWTDDHPLNKFSTMKEEYFKMFPFPI